MRTRPLALVTLLVLHASWSGLAAADLDDDDKKWLEEVAPISSSDEERIYRDLDSKEDRLEFRKIFWARRDPDLTTPENEFKAEFEAAVQTADKEFRVPGRKGSRTDCGRVFILLGPPDHKRVSPGSVSVLARTPETWIYEPQGDRGEATIALDGNCNAPPGGRDALDQMAGVRITQPQLDYLKDADGNFVSLEDQLPKDSPARTLLKTPRQDFELTADTRFVRVADGDSGVIGVAHGRAPDLSTRKEGGQTVTDVVVTTAAVDGDGNEVWTEQPTRAAILEDGSFLATYGTSLEPGEYNFKVGVLIGEEGRAGSLVTEELTVPDLSRVEETPDGGTRAVPSVASILFVRDIQELDQDTKVDPEQPYAAYRLGATQLIPYPGRALDPGDQVLFFYLIYDLGVDPSNQKANSKVAFSILKNGRTPVAQAPEVPVDTPMTASAVGPVPMKAYPPGKYAVQVKVTDSVTGTTVVKKEEFEIVNPGAAAQ